MGLTTFLSTVLRPREQPQPPPPFATSPPRRRRTPRPRDRDHDRSQPPRPRDRSFESLRPRHQTPPLPRPSLDNPHPVQEEDEYAFPPADFEDEFAFRSTAHLSRRSNKPHPKSPQLTHHHPEPQPSSRRRLAWRRKQGRAASNLEPLRVPPRHNNNTLETQHDIDSFKLKHLRQHPDFIDVYKVPPSPRRASPFDDSPSPSLKRLFARGASPSQNTPTRKQHGRIRSSLDYFMRREHSSTSDRKTPRSFNATSEPLDVEIVKERVQALEKLPDTELTQLPKRIFADPEAVAPPMRFSTDASFPNRPLPVLTTPFTRSQSNPAASITGFAAKRALRRPPPLITPVGGGTGFAGGVGADGAGVKRVPIGRESIEMEKEKRYGVNISVVTIEADPNDREVVPVESEKEKDGGFEMWDPNQKVDHARKSKDHDVFLFEEASQSSFGDTESPSRVAAKNGIIPMERHQELTSVTEDHFVFGTDGSYNDCGFIISSHGMLEAPESVLRKNSDGLAVEGVPTSSNNLIFVKSLDEFRKGFTFKDDAPEGSSTLGRGAAGRVSLAVHKPTGRKIAVKEINVYDEDKRNQLTKELETLISHQSRFLVRSFGAFYDGAGVVSVTLEYMDRGALSDIIQQRGRIPEPVICKIAEHCLRGLCFLHDNHILHRDIKTGNILLSRKLCRAKLSDFGLARNLEQGSSWTDTFVGTLGYMSPERLHGSDYTYASDVWSLGISMLECAMGRFPFDKPVTYFDVVNAVTSNPSSLVEGEVSSGFLDFIGLCTDTDPTKRSPARELLEHEWIRSYRDDANALREWLDSTPTLHCEDAEIGSELAFALKAEKQAKTIAKIRAKAVESGL